MSIRQTVYNVNVDKGNYQLVDAQIEKLRLEELELKHTIIEDIAEVNFVADKIRLCHFSDLVIIGIGGSSLSSKVFTNYNLTYSKLRVHYLENIDYCYIEYILNKINFEKTIFLLISKSGNSFETVAVFDILLQKLAVRYDDFNFKKHLYCIVEFTDNIIYNIARSLNANLIQHKNIGGRFSAFTNVGMLAASLCGLDIKKIKEGANDSLKKLYFKNSYVREFLAILLTVKSDVSNIVMMPYTNKLVGLSELFKQIWSESLGKNNFHITPVDATGTIDQHSQLELYLGGAPNKLFNIITFSNCNDKSAKLLLGSAKGKTINELMLVEAEATIKSLVDAGLPVRHIEIDDFSEYDLGNLLANLMFEIILVARTLKINPFDQPKVEGNKILVAKKLAQ